MRLPRPIVAIALAFIATLFSLPTHDALRALDNELYDIGISSIPAKPPKDMVILGIDETFMKGRHAYLAPRDRLATLIRNVASGKPRAIALDVWLDSRIDDGPHGVDAQLKAALHFAKGLGVPVFLAALPSAETEFAMDSDNGQTAHGSVIPYFASEAQTGSVLFPTDDDGVIRSQLREDPENLSLPAQVALAAGAPAANLSGLEAASQPLDYCGPPGTVATQSAADFLEPSLAPLLQGQVVFIGATYPRSRDYQHTPYSQIRAKPMYGVELLAQASDAIRRGSPRRSDSPVSAQLFDFGLVVVLAVIVAFLALQGTTIGLGSAAGLILLAGFCAVASARDVTALWGFRFHPASPFALSLGLAAAGGVAWRSVLQARELKRVRDTFGAYVGAQVLESLGDKMPELGGETRPIAVLFCDIRGYSALAESMSSDPKALLDELNAHFAPLVAALQNRGAYVDNYVGDLVMALFGAPFSSGSYQGDVSAAVLAALDFVSIIDERNIARREQGLFPIEVGIGVHCGEAVVGNMGSTDAKSGGKIHYTAIGDVVNVASRIESATRGQNVALLVTGDVVAACQGAAGLPEWERIGEVNVKGRAAAVEIFKVEE